MTAHAAGSGTTRMPRSRSRVHRALVAGAVGAAVLLAGCGGQDPDVTVGLITKQEENPYWVTMREVAETVAGDENVRLLTATGSGDADVESQVEALARMTEEGADGILIAPTDSEAVVPAIEEARAAGVTVIAVDTPTEPEDAVDALFATDNEEAGRLAGEYAAAKAQEFGLEPRIALLNLTPGGASGLQREAGFLDGFGIGADDPQVVGAGDTEGDRDLGEQVMGDLLAEHPDINVVYAVNEPAALGAVAALQDADVDLGQVVLVTIDGGCEAIKDAVRPGDIDATVQQYPENMAREGVTALAEHARGGPAPSGFLDTGAVLITGSPAPGVESRDVAFGVRNCWGD
ncbi:substrate-binding domain-containing protein [Ornithinicoccus hortensis]|uniref:Mannose-binding protein /fructose-binding protein /ribose-binding protein n=1 Tax=Ornithinicoccus hortensis TaxID=82346 RepID=A0A542YLR2_9MICO|nr:substrate-binding domain-containing protein [Ornithinicoccus hortensis]TQL49013.1 mannose-binding protein /fructose-binding protein /ribose-binding protein [Ornithinicoccus hortensis]